MKSLMLLSVIAVLGGCASAPEAAALVDVKIYDRSSGRELDTYERDGRLYVAGAPGNKYAISIRSRDGGRVLTVVSVDGVNVVSGETASPTQSGYVIDAYRHVEINGWRKSVDQVAAFVFTSLSDSYAARTGRPRDVGVIGVAVFREQAPVVPLAPTLQQDRAATESESKAQESFGPSGARRSERLGTGHGQREASHARYTHFARASRKPAQVIRIYYDSYANLIARGVISRPAYAEPNPFPGRFVPDPWG